MLNLQDLSYDPKFDNEWFKSEILTKMKDIAYSYPIIESNIEG